MSTTTTTTTTETRAQRFAARFDNDGQRWQSLDTGEDFAPAALASGARHSVVDGHPDEERYEWPDGSAILVNAAAWDFQHPDCTCGRCWDGGAHDGFNDEPPPCAVAQSDDSDDPCPLDEAKAGGYVSDNGAAAGEADECDGCTRECAGRDLE